MKAFLFKPSNEYIGKFFVDSFDEVPRELQKFMDRTRSAPDYSYVEFNGRRWTLLSAEPFRVETGRLPPHPAATPLSDAEVLDRASQPSEIPVPIKKTVHELRFFGSLGLAVILLLVIASFAESPPTYVVVGLIAALCQSFLYFGAAASLKNRSPTAKTLAIIAAVCALPAIPVGTIVGLVWLVRINSSQAASWFANVPPSNSGNRD